MSPTKTEYKHIYFAEAVSVPRKAKDIWLCLNNKSDEKLAALEWYAPWRRYCVTDVLDNAVFDADCLRDIAHFLDQLNMGD